MKKAEGAAAKGKEKEGPSFENALERLEKIVEEMEKGSLGLEDMIARFEEGQKLIALCSRKLNEVEKRIEILVKKGGEVTTEPFEAEEEGDEEKAEAEKPGGKGEKELF